jgi:hypothetical protein
VIEQTLATLCLVYRRDAVTDELIGQGRRNAQDISDDFGHIREIPEIPKTGPGIVPPSWPAGP